MALLLFYILPSHYWCPGWWSLVILFHDLRWTGLLSLGGEEAGWGGWVGPDFLFCGGGGWVGRQGPGHYTHYLCNLPPFYGKNCQLLHLALLLLLSSFLLPTCHVVISVCDWRNSPTWVLPTTQDPFVRTHSPPSSSCSLPTHVCMCRA